MKKNHIFILLLTLFIFTSCASKEEVSDFDYSYSDEDYMEDMEEISVIQTTDDFLGDYAPIEIEELMFLSKTRKEMKPKQVKNVYLVPRLNTVELKFRDNVNDIVISLSKSDRDKIINICNVFLQQYEEKTLPHHKVNSKTAYLKDRCKLWFGVLSAVIECSKTDYYINCEFINKRPYLIFAFLPTRCDNNNDFTPKISLYMSPTQVRAFIDQMDQETLNAYVQDLNEKAYTY